MTTKLILGEFEIDSNVGMNRFQEKFDGFLVMCRLLGHRVIIKKLFFSVEITIMKKFVGKELLAASFNFILFRNGFFNYTILEIPLLHYKETFHSPYDLYEKMDYLAENL